MKTLTTPARRRAFRSEPEGLLGRGGQVGLDYLINRDWLLNMSVWYMDIDTDVKFKAGGVDQKVSTRLDPWVFMFSAGYRF